MTCHQNRFPYFLKRSSRSCLNEYNFCYQVKNKGSEKGDILDKKEIACKVLAEITAEYDFNGDIDASPSALLGIKQQGAPTGVITLGEMARLLDMINKNSTIKFSSYRRSPL